MHHFFGIFSDELARSKLIHSIFFSSIILSGIYASYIVQYPWVFHGPWVLILFVPFAYFPYIAPIFWILWSGWRFSWRNMIFGTVFSGISISILVAYKIFFLGEGEPLELLYFIFTLYVYPFVFLIALMFPEK